MHGPVPFGVLFRMLLVLVGVLRMLGLLRVRVRLLRRLLVELLEHVRQLVFERVLLVLVGMPRVVLRDVLGSLHRQLRQKLLRVRLDVRVGLHVVGLHVGVHIGMLELLQLVFGHLPGVQRLLRMLVGLLGKLHQLLELVRHVVRRRVQRGLQGGLQERVRLEMHGRMQRRLLVDVLRLLRLLGVVLGRL